MASKNRRTAEQVRIERIAEHSRVKDSLRIAFPNADLSDINRIAINASPFLIKSILRLNNPNADTTTH